MLKSIKHLKVRESDPKLAARQENRCQELNYRPGKRNRSAAG